MKASLCENLELERGQHSALPDFRGSIRENPESTCLHPSKNMEAFAVVGSSKMTFSSPRLRGVYEGEGGLSTPACTPPWQVSQLRGERGSRRGEQYGARAGYQRRCLGQTSHD